MWTQAKAVKIVRSHNKQGMSKCNAYKKSQSSKGCHNRDVLGMVTVLRNRLIVIERLRSQDDII